MVVAAEDQVVDQDHQMLVAQVAEETAVQQRLRDLLLVQVA
jgi:hypothetical protein